MVEIGWAEGKLLNDEFDIFLLEFKVLKHFDKALFWYGFFSIFDFFEGSFEFFWILLLLNKLKVFNNFPQLVKESFVG